MEKKFSKSTLNATKENISVTDRLFHKITSLWSIPATPIPDKAVELQKKSEFSAVTNKLETSARDFKNKDALLLLAELNFVCKIGLHICLTLSHISLVF